MKRFHKALILVSMVTTTVMVSAQNQPTTTAKAAPQEQAVNPDKPVATFDQTLIDMGEIPQGIPKSVEYKLTNSGKDPLLITTAKASCGCTNLKYSSEPLLAGKSTNISATYNAAAAGGFSKTITVITNADNKPVILTFKGKVIPKTPPAKAE
ncbi:MAG TPA: DUF1573 domain-containing protein [Bacteroidales bacterium]|nr:MAG: hypothetical protein A2X11_01840 [Bacteroidetes bacterium GWE2_42_24]OFY29696.1 MAG: hypothetical protein A2X09_01330 [Bacteroidetes bacterium GWF2_43_11]HAQ65183.1 DUF1573 domain-containing protein [Bacteroidales bacterium]HBZ65812.1 DUF1573 domain-containing protein [Bacteroidales bacterium]